MNKNLKVGCPERAHGMISLIAKLSPGSPPHDTKWGVFFFPQFATAVAMGGNWSVFRAIYFIPVSLLSSFILSIHAFLLLYYQQLIRTFRGSSHSPHHRFLTDYSEPSFHEIRLTPPIYAKIPNSYQTDRDH